MFHIEKWNLGKWNLALFFRDDVTESDIIVCFTKALKADLNSSEKHAACERGSVGGRPVRELRVQLVMNDNL